LGGGDWQILVAMVTLVYDFFYPDHHPCTTITEKQECLRERSPYDRTRTTCAWDIYSMTCNYHEIKLDIVMTTGVAVRAM